MTRSCRGLARRSTGSTVMRSTSKRWVLPEPAVTVPTRRTSASNAVGQSFSVPSSRPMRCAVSVTESSSAETRQVVAKLRPPRRPVVRYVVPPYVQLVANALLPKQTGECAGTRQRPRRIDLPRALADDQQQAQLPAQPVE